MLSKTLSLIQQEFVAKYNVTKTIRHKGEKGRQREHGLATLLREHLPMAYGVATGEIVPHNGDDNSPQCDIIIYDQMRYPILGKGDAVQLVPLESVYCVIETKSNLDKKELLDAEAKFSQILAMPRMGARSKLKKNKRREPICVAFAYTLGMSTDDIVARIAPEDPEYMVVALDSGIGLPLLFTGENLSRALWVKTADHLKGEYRTLAWFYGLLLEFMQQVDLGIPNYSGLLIPD